MFQYIVYCMGIFFIVLEFIVLFYIIQGIFYLGTLARMVALFLVEPMLRPMQSLVKRSVMNTFSMDLSPYFLIVLLFYLEKLCNYLLGTVR